MFMYVHKIRNRMYTKNNRMYNRNSCNKNIKTVKFKFFYTKLHKEYFVRVKEFEYTQSTVAHFSSYSESYSKASAVEIRKDGKSGRIFPEIGKRRESWVEREYLKISFGKGKIIELCETILPCDIKSHLGKMFR